METLDKIIWICTIPYRALIDFFRQQHLTIVENPDMISVSGSEHIGHEFYFAPRNSFYKTVFETSSSPAFLASWQERFIIPAEPEQEQDIFESAGIHFIPAPRRENPSVIDRAMTGKLPDTIRSSDIKGIIHSHSNWSDGSQTIEEMAKACITQGFEYLVISDHSKSAFYANGLSEERVKEQHQYINELNSRFAPFYIFKSIESDILNDGSLDYSDQILSTFDLVIASVHSNLKMSEEKAMGRLLAAIKNPHTRILGHPTGRLLLSRAGYPVDHRTLIDACAEYHVVVELNAHPRRLDIDWRWIEYALEKNVMISIDPDAHSIAGYHDIHYGVLSAQKAGVTASHNLSSFTLEEMKSFVSRRKQH